MSFEDAEGHTLMMGVKDGEGTRSSHLNLGRGSGRVHDLPRERLRVRNGGSGRNSQVWTVDLSAYRGRTLELSLDG